MCEKNRSRKRTVVGRSKIISTKVPPVERARLKLGFWLVNSENYKCFRVTYLQFCTLRLQSGGIDCASGNFDASSDVILRYLSAPQLRRRVSRINGVTTPASTHNSNISWRKPLLRVSLEQALKAA